MHIVCRSPRIPVPWCRHELHPQYWQCCGVTAHRWWVVRLVQVRRCGRHRSWDRQWCLSLRCGVLWEIHQMGSSVHAPLWNTCHKHTVMVEGVVSSHTVSRAHHEMPLCGEQIHAQILVMQWATWRPLFPGQSQLLSVVSWGEWSVSC